MGSRSPLAFLNGRRSEHTDNTGDSILPSLPSSARITFSFLPELGMQSHSDALTPDPSGNVQSTPSFVWVPSDGHSSVVNNGCGNLFSVQKMVSNSPTGLSTMFSPWKLGSVLCANPLVHHVRKLASWADSIQAVLMQHGKEGGHEFSGAAIVRQSQNEGMLFCSIGLAGREIGSVEKLNLSQADVSLVSDKHLNEKDNGRGDLDASQRLIQSEDKEGIKDVSENSVFVTAKHLSAGAISAIVSRSVVAPLERLKLEYMVRGAQQNVIQIIQLIVAKEGVQGFWRGNTVNLLRTAPFKSVNFFCYDVYRKRLLELTGKEEVGNFERFIAGAAAGISATLLCFPMDTIRTRLVAPGGEALGGVIGCFQHMLHTEGFFSLYKGLLPAVISMAPSGAVFYGVYDILKTSYLRSPEGQEDLRKRIEMEKRRRGLAQGESVMKEGSEALKEEAGNLGQLELGPMRTLLYGAISGICAETATYPFEVVRRQLQMQNAANRMGALATCQGLVERGGVGALYSGLLPSSLQVLPSAAISYFVYECMKVLWKVS